MTERQLEYWDLWYPQGAATGLSFGRGQVDAGAHQMLVHAAPPVLAVAVRDARGQLVADGAELHATDDTPITRLTRRGSRIERADIWPTDDDLGRLVLLPGGEVGTLVAWWHAADHSEWRWRIELYNHR